MISILFANIIGIKAVFSASQLENRKNIFQCTKYDVLCTMYICYDKMRDYMNEKIIIAKDLKKNYGTREAVRSISFEIKAQSCFGFLGPNGAGKSSTLKMIY